MSVHQFFIDNVNSEEYTIPWDIQAELTYIDLAYVAIQLKLEKDISLDIEYSNQIESHIFSNDLMRINTKSRFDNATITIILYLMFNILYGVEMITINHGVNDLKDHINKFDAEIVDDLYDIIENIELNKTILAEVINAYGQYPEDNYYVYIDEEKEIWSDFIEDVTFVRSLKSARNI